MNKKRANTSGVGKSNNYLCVCVHVCVCVCVQVLRDWKEAMYSCIDERIKISQQLKEKETGSQKQGSFRLFK